LEVIDPLVVVTKPIYCGTVVEEVDTVLDNKPVRLEPEPENEVAVTTPVNLPSPIT